jgi:class 3 adenylate cyclase
MTAKKVVAIGDILGFKETVLKTPLEVIVEQYFGFFRRAFQHALRQQGWPSVPEEFEQLRASAPIGIEWFSDTIVLFAREDTDASSKAVVDAAAWLLFETMYVTAVRLRFGIDYDEVFTSRDAGQIVGRAVVGAHLLEGDQKWSGGAVTQAAAERVGGVSRNDALTEYDIPFKKGMCATRVAVNWTIGDHQPLDIAWSRQSKQPTMQDRRERADIVEKWENTNAFHEKVCFWCPQRRKT